MQDQKTTGELAQYVVNNSGKVVTSATRQVSISDGLTSTCLSADPGNPVNITVHRSTSALSSAVSAFADAYNTWSIPWTRSVGRHKAPWAAAPSFRIWLDALIAWGPIPILNGGQWADAVGLDLAAMANSPSTSSP